jgi:hypothetical protein
MLSVSKRVSAFTVSQRTPPLPPAAFPAESASFFAHFLERRRLAG